MDSITLLTDYKCKCFVPRCYISQAIIVEISDCLNLNT
jgi:hypothetical protein